MSLVIAPTMFINTPNRTVASGVRTATSTSRPSTKSCRNQALGASVVAISPQTAVNSRKSVRTNELGFPVLSDVKNDTAAAFGLRFTLPDYLIELYKKLKNELPAFNGDPSWTLPMPARYVIGQDGVVLYSEVSPDYTHRPDPSEMLPILEKAVTWSTTSASCAPSTLGTSISTISTMS
jgi:peroxiredoxin